MAIAMFIDSFSIEGRISRKEYQLSWLLFAAGCLLVFLLSKIIEDVMLFAACQVFLCWFVAVQGIKRCHYINKSGWMQLLPLYIFNLLFAPGEYGSNSYGNNPVYEIDIAAIEQIGQLQS